MVTKKPVRKKPVAGGAVKPTGVEKIKDVQLHVIADREYAKYGIATIEDRAIFGGLDGLKPVIRRSLWAIHKLGLHSKAKADKAAKAVGETLGNYHPHGDRACFDAMVNACSNQAHPLIDGEGNWGTMTEPAAAMRYINLRLSKYADKVFFDPFYMPMLEYVPNYDGSRVEPLNMIALLPNAVLNGNFGIAPGVNTRSPSYTLDSVVKVCRAALKDMPKGVTLRQCNELEFVTAHGGRPWKQDDWADVMAQFYKTGKARITFLSTHSEPDAANTIRFNRFAPISDIQKVISNIEGVAGVIGCRDDSDENDPFKVGLVVQFQKTLKGDDLDNAVWDVEDCLSTTYTFDVKVTDRILTPEGDVSAKLRNTTIRELLQEWLTYRLDLEVRACKHWTVERKKEIEYIKLMRLAISKIDYLIGVIKNRKLTNEQVTAKVSKDLKITLEQASTLLRRNLLQLRHLEDQKLADQIKELETEIKGYAVRIKNPADYVSNQLGEMLKELK